MKRVVLLFLLVFLVSARGVGAAGPMLKFVPTNTTYVPGQNFDVVLGVDSGTERTAAVDAWVTFDPAQAEIVSIRAATNPAFPFTIMQNVYNDTGKFNISFNSTDSSSFEMKPSVGDLAVITVKPKSNGTINLNFVCTDGSQVDSNIFNFDGKEVLACSLNQNGVYTTTGAAPVATAAPTSASGTTVPTSTELPKTGAVENTIVLMVMGMIGVLSSLALRKL